VSTADSIAEPRHHHQHAPHNTERDPVCGMKVDPATTTNRAEYDRHAYHFCSALCRERFVADPARYLPPDQVSQESSVPVATPGKSLWTCPMHPQIVRSEPGFCPICGMALEPMTPTGADLENPELRDLTRRFWAGVILSLPLLALAMADHLAKVTLDALIAPDSPYGFN
jgi:P-type Cu+ transporter